MNRLFEIHLGAPVVLARRAEPVTVGTPFPRGLLKDPSRMVLLQPSGRELRLQAQVLDRWGDGSARWVLLDFQAEASQASTALMIGLDDVVRTPDKDGLRLATHGDPQRVTVQTGPADFEVGPGEEGVFSKVRLAGGCAVASMDCDIKDAAGVPFNVTFSASQIETHGFLRSVVRCDGVAQHPASDDSLVLTLRLHFFAGLGVVRTELTIHNPRAAEHPGNFWELGAPSSIFLQSACCNVRLTTTHASRPCRVSPEIGAPVQTYTGPVELYQDSSGGENWRSAIHVNGSGKVAHQFCGYRLKTRSSLLEGRRATPVMTILHDDVPVSVAMEHFWQNFPKSVEAGEAGLSLGLFPRQCSDVHELQGGEEKRHVFAVSFARDPVTPIPLDWVRAPLLPRLSPDWYCSSGVVPCLTPAASDPHQGYLRLVNEALDGSSSFVAKRERIDEYGWRHFGEVYADHEGVNSPPDRPLVSHYNNQYDVIAGLLVQFMRTADPRWWSQAGELASHVADIDIYHTDDDKPAYNHGQFWHTFHYCDAGKSSHRSYPRAPGVSGGGPSNEHNYSTGLMLHYVMTGDVSSREATLELAKWTIDMEDGARTKFRWLDRGDTGLSSRTLEDWYHGPGRGPANCIQTLLNAHQLTRDRRYLERAEILIRRCIHPGDNIEARGLRDPERRWFYAVFLQALGRYLDYKADLGEIDETYAWARESLLQYARWAADHEYPYLDRPELLEHPTETWAAQDMRKAEVFNLAVRFGTGQERNRFLERSRFFFDQSVRTLLLMPTHVFTRPTVLMLVNGYSQAWIERHAETLPAPDPVPALDFGRPSVFVPQKVRAIRRAKRLVAAGAAMFAMGAAYAAWRLAGG